MRLLNVMSLVSSRLADSQVCKHSIKPSTIEVGPGTIRHCIDWGSCSRTLNQKMASLNTRKYQSNKIHWEGVECLNFLGFSCSPQLTVVLFSMRNKSELDVNLAQDTTFGNLVFLFISGNCYRMLLRTSNERFFRKPRQYPARAGSHAINSYRINVLFLGLK